MDCPRNIRAVGFLVATLLIVPAPALEAQEPILAEALRGLNHEAMTLSTLLQVVADVGVDGDDPDRRSVQIAAARVRLRGRLDSGFEYLLQTNFAASPSLLDARVGWSASPRFAVHAGRFKAPFSRELLTYAGSIDLVNRARAIDALAPGRQMGLQLSGRDGRVGWTAGAFTGSGNSMPGEPLLGIGRLELTSTPDDGSDTRWAVAVAGGVGEDGAVGGRARGSSFSGSGSLVGADARVEHGRLLLSAEWMMGDWSDDDPMAPDLDAAGGFFTVGWMTTERSQLLARLDRYRSPGDDVDDQLLLGWNLWPTSASEIQVNWALPLNGSGEPGKLLVNFQVGF